MRALTLRAIPFLLLVIVIGCGPSGPRKYEVSGKVTVDGKEVTEGDINFVPDNKSAGADGGKIVNGKYTLKALEGSHKVEIMATRVVPGKKGPLGEDWVEQYIPAQYNEKTTLKATVKSSGNSDVNFELTTKK